MKKRMNLQMFAEDGIGEDDIGQQTEPKEVSFDELLKDKKYQSEFDRRVQESVKNGVAKAQAKWEAINNAQLTEAEKLSKMNEDEKKEYRIRKLEEEINGYREQESLGKIKTTARDILNEKNIPIGEELLSAIVTSDADKTNKAIENFATLFEAAVETAVKDRLKGKTPNAGGGKPTMTKEEIYAIKDTALRQAKMLENRELFNF